MYYQLYNQDWARPTPGSKEGGARRKDQRNSALNRCGKRWKTHHFMRDLMDVSRDISNKWDITDQLDRFMIGYLGVSEKKSSHLVGMILQWQWGYSHAQTITPNSLRVGWLSIAMSFCQKVKMYFAVWVNVYFCNQVSERLPSSNETRQMEILTNGGLKKRINYRWEVFQQATLRRLIAGG